PPLRGCTRGVVLTLVGCVESSMTHHLRPARCVIEDSTHPTKDLLVHPLKFITRSNLRRCGPTNRCFSGILLTVVVEAEHRGGAAGPVHVRQPDGQSPERARDPTASRSLVTPGLKPAPPSRQIRRQRPALACAHRGPPHQGPPG